MKCNRLKLSVLLFFGFGMTGLHAQESVNATGGNALGNGGSASYSVGQIVYTTNTGTNVSETQGVQQPYEISLVTGLEEIKGIKLSVTAFPNPTSDNLTLEVADSGHSNLSFQLFDMQGALLQSEKITGRRTTIVMSNLVPATYFLQVLGASQVVQTFKIIKN